MRRPASLTFLVLTSAALLGGCTGFGTFLDHTASLPGDNPNLPQADSENVRRSLGQAAPVAPLTPEAGDVWPAAPAVAPTLSDIAHNPTLQNQFAPTAVPGERPGLPDSHQPVPVAPPSGAPPALPNTQQQDQANPKQKAQSKKAQHRRGSSTPPGSTEPGFSTVPAPPGPPAVGEPALPGVPATRPPGGAVQLPSGVGVDTGGTSGYRQLTLPNGQPGAIIVPNGNGTSTVIGPDGSVQTVPTPKR